MALLMRVALFYLVYRAVKLALKTFFPTQKPPLKKKSSKEAIDAEFEVID